MEYQEHLLKNVFNGDEKRFQKAWQEALDEGCESAVSWTSLLEPAKKKEVTKQFNVHAITRFEGLPNSLTGCSYQPFASYFVWKK